MERYTLPILYTQAGWLLGYRAPSTHLVRKIAEEFCMKDGRELSKGYFP